MRLNKFVALATGISRRKADETIASGLVAINDQTATVGSSVKDNDIVKLSGKIIKPEETDTVLLNKPTGYVCSRHGQGSKTIYDLLPERYKNLKAVGRLDKDSTGLILLTNDGELANKLTHPRYQKEKVYQVILNKPLATTDKEKLLQGVILSDGVSKFQKAIRLKPTFYEVTLSEGRNRQIRRTFQELGYEVAGLHRIKFGKYELPKHIALGEHLVLHE